jgi:predicted nucleic acid-binding protein
MTSLSLCKREIRVSFYIIILCDITLGYNKLSAKDLPKIKSLFNILNVLWLSDHIATKAIEISRNYKLKLADAIIAATSIVNSLTLVTRNTKDFQKIKKLSLLNPFEL